MSFLYLLLEFGNRCTNVLFINGNHQVIILKMHYRKLSCTLWLDQNVDAKASTCWKAILLFSFFFSFFLFFSFLFFSFLFFSFLSFFSFWVNICCQCQSCLNINESTYSPIKWKFRHLASFSIRPLNFLFYCCLIPNFGYFDSVLKEIRTCVLIPTQFSNL